MKYTLFTILLMINRTVYINILNILLQSQPMMYIFSVFSPDEESWEVKDTRSNVAVDKSEVNASTIEETQDKYREDEDNESNKGTLKSKNKQEREKRKLEKETEKFIREMKKREKEAEKKEKKDQEQKEKEERSKKKKRKRNKKSRIERIQ